MAYDAERERTVLFGRHNVLDPLQDTWEWDGTDWSERTATSSVTHAHALAMTYDEARKRVVMYMTSVDNTWEWDGADWIKHPLG